MCDTTILQHNRNLLFLLNYRNFEVQIFHLQIINPKFL